KKMKEMIVDFRRGRHDHLPLHVGGSAVEVVSSYRYFGVHLSNNLTWSNNTSSLVRKAHQRLYFLRRLRRAGLGSSVLTSFYRCVVESVLCSSINVWHESCSAADRKALQMVVEAARRSVGVSLPTTMDIYTTSCRKRANCIMKDPTHPAHSLFVPLPSGRRLWSINCKTNRLRNSSIPEASSAVLVPLPALLGGVEEPDGSWDKGSPESVCGAALSQQPATEIAPSVHDDDVQWVPIIIHNRKQFVQCPPLRHLHHQVQLHTNN
ncbi:hypothetical protein NFI96_007553, partial [Prochilodus magdalenae]